MTDHAHDVAWLARRLIAEPEIADYAADSLAGDWSTNSCLRTRRWLERSVGMRLEDSISDDSYRIAAEELRDAGRSAAATAIDAIGATGPELETAAKAWQDRYLARPMTSHPRDAAALMLTGAVEEHPGRIIGPDGAQYGAALISPLGDRKGAVPAATVRTRGTGLEIVTGFEDAHARDRWLADREPFRNGPVETLTSGPACRVAAEETALACLLQTGSDAAPFAAGLRPDAFTADGRYEIFAAWRSVTDVPGEHFRYEYALALHSRLLRVPGWAASAAGWLPDGDVVVRYRIRLRDTPVAAEQGRAAVDYLIREDTAAVMSSRQPRGPVISPPGPRPGLDRVSLVPQPRRPMPEPDGPTWCM